MTTKRKGKKVNQRNFVGVVLSKSEKDLIVKYYKNISPAIRFLIQTQLSTIVFDDEFLELVEGLPIETKNLLSKKRTEARKRIYSKSDLKDIQEAEIV